ncbi:MAG: thioredoxin [Erysipelotrichaceae bacterium]|nr:thioredoxin [Erysipelotrichaceae bacterium]
MSTITITNENFEREVLQADKPVLVDFWAEWCGPCRMLAPTLEEIADQYKGNVLVGKVNVDSQQALAGRYQIMSIPTLMVFKNGEVADRKTGVQPKAVIEEMIRP